MSLQSRLSTLISAVGADIKALRSYTTSTTLTTVTPSSLYHMVTLTAQASALTIANPSGSPIEGQSLIIRIKDNGTARALTYGTQYRAIGVTLPTTTVVSKTLYLGCMFNAVDTKWDVLAVGQEA